MKALLTFLFYTSTLLFKATTFISTNHRHPYPTFSSDVRNACGIFLQRSAVNSVGRQTKGGQELNESVGIRQGDNSAQDTAGTSVKCVRSLLLDSKVHHLYLPCGPVWPDVFLGILYKVFPTERHELEERELLTKTCVKSYTWWWSWYHRLHGLRFGPSPGTQLSESPSGARSSCVWQLNQRFSCALNEEQRDPIKNHAWKITTLTLTFHSLLRDPRHLDVMSQAVKRLRCPTKQHCSLYGSVWSIYTDSSEVEMA